MNPWDAVVASAVSFTLCAILLLPAILLPSEVRHVPVTFAAVRAARPSEVVGASTSSEAAAQRIRPLFLVAKGWRCEAPSLPSSKRGGSPILDAFGDSVGDAQCIGDDGQGRVDGADGGHEAAIDDVVMVTRANGGPVHRPRLTCMIPPSMNTDVDVR